MRRARETWSHPIRGGGRTGRGATSEGDLGDPLDSGAPGHRARRAAARVYGLELSWHVDTGGLEPAARWWPGKAGRTPSLGGRRPWREQTCQCSEQDRGMRNGESASFLQTPPMSLWDASSLSWRGSDFAVSQRGAAAGPLGVGLPGGPCKEPGGKGRGMGLGRAPRLPSALAGPAVGCTVLSSRGGAACSGRPRQIWGSLRVSAMGRASQPCCPSEQPPSFLSA